MAQAMASMSGLHGSTQAVLEGSRQLSGSSRLSSPHASRVSTVKPGFVVRAQQGSEEKEASRRSVLGLVAAGLATGSFVQATWAAATPIKIGGPPPPSGGLPGTLNSDQARDTTLPLKERFFIQPLSPTEAAERAKVSAKEILNVKGLIEKKAWPYVQNDLRLRAEYLRYDLNTIISSKPKPEKTALKDLTSKLFQNISDLDYAAKKKSSSAAEKSYAATKGSIDDVLAKLS